MLGTLIPPMVHRTLGDVLHKTGANWVMAGIVVGVLGIACAGWAGWLKEKDLTAQKNRGEFSLSKGLLLSLLAGVLSTRSVTALDKGTPIADVAAAHGAGVFRGNVVYIFSNTGAFLTAAIYCLWLHKRHKTLGELIELPAGPEKASLPVNFFMAVASRRLFWYVQFFSFHNLGHVQLGDKFAFTSWAIHMIMLVLFSNLMGVLLRRMDSMPPANHAQRWAWHCSYWSLAVLFLTYGNHLGDLAAK